MMKTGKWKSKAGNRPVEQYLTGIPADRFETGLPASSCTLKTIGSLRNPQKIFGRFEIVFK